MVERTQIEITKVKEKQPIGDKGAVKLAFTGKAGDGTGELQYFTFSTKLFDHIQEGKAIDAEVETSKREYAGNTYTDRKLVNVYVDGQPVAKKDDSGRRYGKSPEVTTSIETQVAVKVITELEIAGKATPTLIELRDAWLLSKFPSPAPITKPPPQHITVEQKHEILEACEEKGLSAKAIGVYIAGAFGKGHSRELLKAEATQLIEAIEGGKITVGDKNA